MLAHNAWALSAERLQGGLSLRSRAPLFDNGLSYPTGRTQLLRRHEAEALLALSHVNTWAQMPGYFFDGEFSRLELRLAYGVTAKTELALHLAALRRSGGIMDGFIEGFHALMNITQSRRDLHPRNTLRVSTFDGQYERPALGSGDTGMGLMSPVIVLRHNLTRAVEASHPYAPSIKGELHVQLPLWPDPQGYRINGPAALLALSLSQPLHRLVHLFAAGGVMIRPVRRSLYGMPLAGIGKFVLLGAGVQVRRDVALALHWLIQDGMVESAQFFPMHLATHEFVLGAKWAPRFWRGGVFELGIIENSVHDANTPDFGVTLAMGWATG